MRFVLASLLILCAGNASAREAQSSTPQTPEHTQSKSTQSQAGESHVDKKIAKEPQTAVSAESNATTHYYQDDGRDKGIKEASDILLALFTAALVIVGYWQYRALKNHEKWMEKNVEIVTKVADAAKKNADAAEANAIAAEANTNTLKNIYRAWVLLEWKQRPGATAEQFDFYIKNWGQTPAKIELSALSGTIIPKEDLGDLPDADVFFITNNTLAPSESILIYSGNARPSDQKKWVPIANESNVFVWYGSVTYRDILNPSILHETGFCYWYSGRRSGLHVGGPAKYNTTT
jgi:hypothetical protein